MVHAEYLQRADEVGTDLDVGVGAQQRLDLLGSLDLDAAAGGVDDVDLPGTHGSDAGSLLLHEQAPELIRVRELVVGKFLVMTPVVGVAGPGYRGALDVVGQHVGSGADHVFPVRVVAVLLDHLGRQDPLNHLGQIHAQRPEARLGKLEHDRVVVGRFDRLPRQPDHFVGALGHEVGKSRPAPERVHHVVGGQFASVHRLLVMPVHALPYVQNGRQFIRLLPALGQAADEARCRHVPPGQAHLVAGRGPVAECELLVDRRDQPAGVVSTQVRVGVRGHQLVRVGQRAAVLGRGQHLAGSRVGNHRLVHGLVRGLALACRPRAGCGQGEHEHKPRSTRDSRNVHVDFLPLLISRVHR